MERTFPQIFILFGAKVFYTPATTKANAAEHKFSPSSVAGILIGYHLNPGGEWSKDYFVINLETALNGNTTRYLPVLRVGKVFRESGPPVFPLKDREIQLTGAEPPAGEPSQQIQTQGVDAA